METLHWANIVPGDEAFHAMRAIRTQREPVREHGHDFAEVMWVDEGSATHRLNGEEMPLHRGSLVFIRPADWHGIEPFAGNSLRLTNIAFTQQTFAHLESRYGTTGLCDAGYREGMMGRGATQPLTFQLDAALLQTFNHWADELAQSPRKLLFIERFLLNMLVALRPHQAHTFPEAAPQWLIRACREIRHPQNFVHGVAAFIELTGRSREHAARCTRQFLGMTPTEYVNLIRMEHAARRLEMSNDSILDIALECGIENLSHFYTLFRLQFGTTPRIYRLEHRRLV